MFKKALTTLFAAGLLVTLPPVAGATESAAGVWETIDEKTGQPVSLVKIARHDTRWSGNVVQILDEGSRRELCHQCNGHRKNQPIEGMEIIWGLKQIGNQLKGGKILDPENGKVYSVSLKVINQGKNLEVRGYIGHPAIGRTQVWSRSRAL